MSVAAAHTGPWTLADVLALTEDGTHTRHELIDGTLLVTPAPSYPHQRAARRLLILLEEAARQAGAAVEVFETVNVETASGLAIPDVAVVRAEAARLARVTLPAAAMLAVIEIVSPSTRRIDRLVKPGVYAEAGVPAFWRVELDPSPTVATFILTPDGQYAQTAVVHGSGLVTVVDPFPVTFRPTDLTTT